MLPGFSSGAFFIFGKVAAVTFLPYQRQKVDINNGEFCFLWNFLSKFNRAILLDQKRILIKWQQKNRGNRKLTEAIDDLILYLENSTIESHLDLLKERKDADQVHSKGVFFFNIQCDRVLVAVKFLEKRAIVLWIGTHRSYERVFKNNKATIEKWLRLNGHIQ